MGNHPKQYDSQRIDAKRQAWRIMGHALTSDLSLRAMDWLSEHCDVLTVSHLANEWTIIVNGAQFISDDRSYALAQAVIQRAEYLGLK